VLIVCAGSAAAWIVDLKTGGALFAFLRASIQPPNPNTSEAELPVRELIEQFRQAVIRHPRTWSAWLRFGQVLEAHSFYPDAIVAYEQAHRLNPSDFQSAYYLARLHDISGTNLELAATRYLEAEEIRRDYAPLFVRLGDLLLRKGDFRRALEAYSNAIRLVPRLPDGYRGRGQAHLGLGEANEARRDLEEAIALRPEDGVAYSALSQVYARIGEQAKSDELAEAARRLAAPTHLVDPLRDEVSSLGVSSSARWQRCLDYIRLGEFKRAMVELDWVAQMRPDDPQVYVRRGECLEKTNRPREALEQYRKALALQSDLRQAHLRTGIILFSSGQLETALGHLREALPTAREPGVVRSIIAIILAKLGRPAEAVTEFEAASLAAELDAQAQNNWGCALMELDRYDESQRHLSEAIRKDPKYAEAHHNMGRLLSKQSRHTEAIDYLNHALLLQPQIAESQFALAEIYQKLGRLDEARVHYRAGVDLNPNHQAARRLQGLAVPSSNR